jgi:hypothetical protein
MSRRACVVFLFLGLPLLSQESRPRFPPPIDDGEASIDAEDLRKDIAFLASDEMKGRRTGSDEERVAGDYIAKRFAACGLEPAGEGKTWTQKFRAVAFTGTNVLGVLPGSSEAKAGEYVVVGAHYDHVGLGTFGSRTNASGQIHHGADDNASGASALLELAGAFSKKRAERSILFLAFSGEEMGLIGSHAWCEQPSRPLVKVVAMVNLDMVGRCRGDYLYVGGAGTGLGFPDLVRKESEGFPFRIEMGPGGTGPSDFDSFYRKDIPVLCFFTGMHDEYHTPGDVAALINTADEAGVVRLAYRVIRRLGDEQKRPAFRKDDRMAMPEQLLPQYGRQDEMQGPRLGIRIADAGAQGAAITGVEAKSPAAEAGIKEGDVLVSLNGARPKHGFDLLSILGTIPGKATVSIALLREGKPLTKSIVVN